MDIFIVETYISGPNVHDRGQLIFVDTLIEFLSVKEPRHDNISIEKATLKSIDSLVQVRSQTRQDNRRGSQILTRRADSGLTNLTKTGTGLPALRAIKTRSTVPYCICVSSKTFK